MQSIHLTHLVDDLSLLARADSGAVSVERSAVDLARLARETVEGIAILAEERGIRLTRDAQGQIHVLGDAGRLRQVLMILLDNALKYTPEGGTVAVSLARAATDSVTGARQRARASPRMTCRTSSTASTAPTALAAAKGPAWGSPSAAGSPRRTAARSRLPTRPTAAPSSPSRCRWLPRNLAYA